MQENTKFVLTGDSVTRLLRTSDKIIFLGGVEREADFFFCFS